MGKTKKTFQDFFSPKNFSMLTQNFKKITPYEVLLIFLVGCDVMCEQKWAPSLKILYSFFCYNSFSHLNARLNFAEKIFDKKFIGYDPPSLFFSLTFVISVGSLIIPFQRPPAYWGSIFFYLEQGWRGKKIRKGIKTVNSIFERKFFRLRDAFQNKWINSVGQNDFETWWSH